MKAPKKDKAAKSATSDAQKPAKKTKKAKAVESFEAPAPEFPEPVADIHEPKKAVKVKRSKKAAAAAVAIVRASWLSASHSALPDSHYCDVPRMKCFFCTTQLFHVPVVMVLHFSPMSLDLLDYLHRSPPACV